MGTITNWREMHRESEERMLAVEAVALELRLPDGFTVSCGYEVSWCRWGYEALPEGDDRTSLQEFCDRVKLVTDVMGRAPDDVLTEGGGEEQAPNLKAVWKVPFEHGWAKELLVKVHTFSPKDCQLHPESGYVPQVWSKGHDAAIHPECAAVLKTLEDLEPRVQA